MKISVNYYLSAKIGNANIKISLHCDDKRLLRSTGLTIDAKYWDFAAKRPRRGYRYEFQVNKYLDGIRNEIQDYFYDNLSIINMAMIEKKLIQLLNRRPSDNILTNFDDYISGLKQSNKLRENSIKRYITCRNHFADYLQMNKLDSYAIFTSEFAEDFINYLIHNKNITNGTAIRNFKYLKTFVLWAVRNGYCKVNTELLTLKNSSLNKKNSRTIALTMSELELIQNYEPTTETLAGVKSMFLIQCFSGLRYSDLANLNKSDVDFDNSEIRLQTMKTDSGIIIPIHNRLRAALETYNFNQISNQKYNQYLKILCQAAGITNDEKTVNYHGLQRTDTIKPRWQLVTSHTGRRTFITLMLKSGVIPEMIMPVTGHKQKNSFDLYVKIIQQEAMKKIKSAWDK